MKNIGFSIYPAHVKLEDNLAYIDKANKYGYKRIFTCLLSVEGDKNKIIDELKKIQTNGTVPWKMSLTQ